MNLSEWNKLTPEERKAWMASRSPKDLTNLLIMVGEMLELAAEWDAEIAMLIEPSNDITIARNNTYNALRSVEQYITRELKEKNITFQTM